jgi:hypothetical protein
LRWRKVLWVVWSSTRGRGFRLQWSMWRRKGPFIVLVSNSVVCVCCHRWRTIRQWQAAAGSRPGHASQP